MKPVIGILLGDAAGIGPELVAKMCALDRFSPYCRPLLIGDIRVLKLGQKNANVDFIINSIKNISEASWDGKFSILDQNNLDPDTIKLGQISAESGRITAELLITALRLCMEGVIEGFTFAPLNKAAIKLSGHDFQDEHKLMAHYLQWSGAYGEINVVNDLWTTRVTSHIPFKDIASKLSQESILKAIRLAHESLRKSGLKSPRIAVAALNPHSGENGSCGREEIDIIAPAVSAAKDEGINAMGPYSADTIFINAFNGMYDAVTTMYHDQGQIALKLYSSLTGVTVAAGMPYPITTPSHGTAFDIVGKGIARIDSMEKAVMIASKMAGWGI